MTGANGHVGNNLVKALRERGYEGPCLCAGHQRPRENTFLLPVGDIELVSLDVRDEPPVRRSEQGVDMLFHVAATSKNYTSSTTRSRRDAARRPSKGRAAAVMAAARATG